jgi:serine/threonine protein kinase
LPIPDEQWTSVAPTEFPHEQEAFDFIKQRAKQVVGAWSNFEFVEHGGKIYEIDLMVLTATQLFLIEIKSWSGILDGTMNNMVRYSRGNRFPRQVTNPIILLNRKAKVLAGLLQEQKALGNFRVPFVQSVLFFNNSNLEVKIAPEDRPFVYYRDEIVQGLTPKPEDLQNPYKRLTSPWVKALNKAFKNVGIRPPSSRTLKVGEWVIRELLEDGDLYQDHLAQHQSFGETYRRVRTFSVPAQSNPETRALARRAAQREFKLTDALNHPGILKPYNFADHELGPALVFPYDPKAERLDHYLAARDNELGLEQRLDLIRQLADVLRYAHARRVFHRGLSPQTMLVRNHESGPELQVMGWQTGMELGGTQGTSHIGDLMTKSGKSYLSPEAFHRPADSSGELADVFGLGAVAFHILTGAPPAESQLDLYQKLQDHPGLRLSAVTDGLGPKLESFVELCTQPLVQKRPATIQAAVELLDKVDQRPENEEPPELENILEAKAGDCLPDGSRVIKRLGKGAMALALEIERDGVSCVLKVAHDSAHEDKMLREGEALQALDHPHIIKFYDIEQIGQRPCLVLQKAGDETLAERLSENGPLQLDLLERFGLDLLKAVIHLEETGVRHRDIKPANIGVTLHKKDDALHLMLFDFSLAGVPDDNIEAGTRDYIDPFLINSRPPRWDPSAERYSAAMTLHEMATGVLPRWGDGKSHPGVDKEAPLVLEAERFDPAVREKLTQFFGTALHRERKKRFHNAEEMLKAWSQVFKGQQAESEKSQANARELEALISQATLDTTLASLRLEVRMLRALEHLNAHTVKEFLQLSGGSILTASGVGHKTRKKLVELQDDLRDRLEDELLQLASEESPEAEDQGLLEVFLATVMGLEKSADEEAMKAYLGLRDSATAKIWPTLGEVCRICQIEPQKLARKVPGWRRSWGKLPSLQFIRNELATLLKENGGIVTTSEVALGLLSHHGSFSNDKDRRLQMATALTRAAVEAEQTAPSPRFLWERVGHDPLIATGQAQVRYLKRLADVADRCAVQEPLLSPARVREEVAALEAPEDVSQITPHRLLRLAASCSAQAAVSSREEFYPRNMPAARALTLAHGAILGPKALTPEQLRDRVRIRYPEAEPLPARPALDEILRKVDPDLRWSESEESYQRRSPVAFTSTAGSSSLHRRLSTTSGTRAPGTHPDVAEARRFEERLNQACKDEDFLVLMVEPQKLQRAEEELLNRFTLQRRDLNQMLLQTMRDLATEKKVPWEKMLLGDAQKQSKAWKVLRTRLVPDAMKTVRQQLLGDKKPQLLLNASLLARYEQMGLLEQMRDLAGARDGLSSVWLLLPSEDIARPPTLEGQAVPLIHGGQKTRIPDAWLVNKHRTGKEKLIRQ